MIIDRLPLIRLAVGTVLNKSIPKILRPALSRPIFPFEPEFGSNFRSYVRVRENFGERRSDDGTYRKLRCILANAKGPTTALAEIVGLLRQVVTVSDIVRSCGSPPAGSFPAQVSNNPLLALVLH